MVSINNEAWPPRKITQILELITLLSLSITVAGYAWINVICYRVGVNPRSYFSIGDYLSAVIKMEIVFPATIAIFCILSFFKNEKKVYNELLGVRIFLWNTFRAFSFIITALQCLVFIGSVVKFFNCEMKWKDVGNLSLEVLLYYLVGVIILILIFIADRYFFKSRTEMKIAICIFLIPLMVSILDAHLYLSNWHDDLNDSENLFVLENEEISAKAWKLLIAGDKNLMFVQRSTSKPRLVPVSQIKGIDFRPAN